MQTRRGDARNDPRRRLGHRQSRNAWRGALWACGLNAVGMPLDILIAWEVPDMPRWPPLVSSAAGVLLVVVLLAARRHADRPARADGVSGQHRGHAGGALDHQRRLRGRAGAVDPVPGQQARRARRRDAGARSRRRADLAIAGSSGWCCCRYLTLPRRSQNRFPIGEPWTILIYAAVRHGVARLPRAHASRSPGGCCASAPNRSRRSGWRGRFWPLRDFTNTPLQTIELAADILRRRDPSWGRSSTGSIGRWIASIVSTTRFRSTSRRSSGPKKT